jgi:antitoxin component YwqK of YwqJK toxin-antitoxin module
MQDKTPRNKQNQIHGCWIRYATNGKLWFKCYYINGKQCGLDETYSLVDETRITKLYYAR